jgi:ribosomal protein S18 acetylase RimI-like enzyme
MIALPDIRLSSLDEARFGVRTARVNAVTVEQLPAIMEFCRANAVTFLIARCGVGDLPAAQAMEQSGFELMDTLLYYSRDLKGHPIPQLTNDVTLRPVQPSDDNAIGELARRAFQGYGGHYHADPRLDRALCDETYVSWAKRSCVSHEVANDVIAAMVDDKIAGFITLRLNNPIEGEVPLYGVDPVLQGRGIGRSLVIGALEWCKAQGAERLLISTQVTNIASQKVWVRLGFEPLTAYYTFHRWFQNV